MKISFVAITLLSLILKEVLCQTCKVYNQENNLLTMAVNETFRLPLNNYFIGEGLQYELSNNSGFTLAQQQWGPSEINGTIISTTSVQFNNNLNIVTFQYFALVSQNNEYQILGSNITMDPLLVTYSNILNTINNATCYTINYVQGYIFVTCSLMNNGLVFYFYQLNGVFQQNYSYPQIILSNNSVITTQTNFNYMILLINEGQIVNGKYISSFSKIYTFPYIQITPPKAAPTPHILSVEGGNYFTGISITDEDILFIATYYEGISFLVFGLPGLTQIMNPFGSGTLGFKIQIYNLISIHLTFIIKFNIIEKSEIFFLYFAIWSNEGMIIGICNLKSNQIRFPSKIIINNQINMNNFLQTQVYINARYVIVANDNGISVYPNILNEINEGKLLYYYPQNSIVSLFDYQNNILISISDIGTYTYQFNNPVLSTSQQQQIEIAQKFSITAKTNSFNQTAILLRQIFKQKKNLINFNN